MSILHFKSKNLKSRTILIQYVIVTIKCTVMGWALGVKKHKKS